MGPFAEGQTRLKPSLLTRLSMRRAALVFALCLVVGLGAVAWRAKVRAETARAIARTEARARGASLELQFSQVSAAAEVLGTLARQARGGITNFQKVATELLRAHPGLASLELQPGGVVSDIVPRAGHERAVGFNALKDAVQRVGANEAIARRVLTVAGPVTLDHGEQGLIARVPLFQRTRDGRDSFWGFVAVSMRLQEALGRAQVDDLLRQGYNFAFFTPPSVQQKGVAIVSHGLSSLQDTVQQPVRAQNLQFRLALKPQGGWVDKTKVVLESLAVLLMSGLVSLSVNLLKSRRAVAAALREATQRLTREVADRNQAQEDCRGAKESIVTAQAELKQTQLGLQQAESRAAQVQARLDASVRAREEAAQVSQADLKETQAALQTAQETIAQMQSRVDATAQAEKDTASAAQKRLQQNQAAMAELQVRLDAATRSARETAETTAARLAQLEQSNRELKDRLFVAEQAEARVTELTVLLKAARPELKHRQEASSKCASALPSGSDGLGSSQSIDPGFGRELSVDLSGKSSPAPGSSLVEEASAKILTEKPAPVSKGNGGLSSTEPLTLVAAPVPSKGTKADSPAPLGSAEAAVEIPTPDGPSVTHRAARKSPKRRKARRDDQMDLFGNKVSAVQATNEPTGKVADRVLEAKEPRISAIEISAASATPYSDQARTATRKAGSQPSLQQNPKRPGPKPQPAAQPGTAAAEVHPASGAALLTLSDIEGLATSEGLANADEDPKRYLKALGQFTEEHANAPKKIRDALLQGDLPAAQRVVQALKIAAGEIGATAVHKAAVVLARACHERSDPSEIESLWGGLEKVLRDLVVALKAVVQPKEDKPAPSRRLPAAPPVDPAQLRKAVNQIVPLLADQDPGAKDCLRDNRTTFRSAFTPEAYVEFEQLVKSGDLNAALQQLKKAARKHEISL